MRTSHEPASGATTCERSTSRLAELRRVASIAARYRLIPPRASRDPPYATMPRQRPHAHVKLEDSNLDRDTPRLEHKHSLSVPESWADGMSEPSDQVGVGPDLYTRQARTTPLPETDQFEPFARHYSTSAPAKSSASMSYVPVEYVLADIQRDIANVRLHLQQQDKIIRSPAVPSNSQLYAPASHLRPSKPSGRIPLPRIVSISSSDASAVDIAEPETLASPTNVGSGSINQMPDSIFSEKDDTPSRMSQTELIGLGIGGASRRSPQPSPNNPLCRLLVFTINFVKTFLLYSLLLSIPLACIGLALFYANGNIWLDELWKQQAVSLGIAAPDQLWRYSEWH